jgi:Amt family ammonium transporter
MEINSGDTAFMLLSTALVMLMTPGLAMFYGGMVRAKNVLNTILQSFFLLGLITIGWAVVGYSLAFGPDCGHAIGGLAYAFLAGVGADPNPDLAKTIPHIVFMAFHAMFAIITPALVTGTIAERAKFGGLMLFFLLWQFLVYAPVAHWVWAPGGWLREMGALDFAGGTAVHILSAVSAAALLVVIGPRIGHPHEPMPPHSLPLTMLGAGLLWFGWFGFNAGSALAANGVAASAFVATHLAAAAATLSWAAMEWLRQGKPTALGAASGCVAGLVAITPAAGFVAPMPAIVIGLLAGVVCYVAVSAKARLGHDDSLDVFGIHGVGGALGALLTGVFASTLVNADGKDGLLSGNPQQVLVQLVAIGAIALFGFGASLVLAKVCHSLVGLRVRADSEIVGLDNTEHAERGYSYY